MSTELWTGFVDDVEVTTLIGYIRISTDKQDLEMQRGKLTDAGCYRIFEDVRSGRSADRPGLVAALDYLRAGDTFVIWRLDRLARSVKDALTVADGLLERDVQLRILNGSISGTYTAHGEGKFFFTVMAAFAELERDMIAERTRIGLAAAREQGRIGGRPFKMNDDMLTVARTRRERGESYAEIGKALGVSRATVHRHLTTRFPELSA